MKFSYRAHPVLRFLERGNLIDIAYAAEDLVHMPEGFTHKISTTFRLLANHFRYRIHALSAPFSEAMILAGEKMVSNDMFQTDQIECGTFIDSNGIAYCYYFSPFTLSSCGDRVIFAIDPANGGTVKYAHIQSAKKNSFDAFVSSSLCTSFEKNAPFMQAMQNKYGLQVSQEQLLQQVDDAIITYAVGFFNFLKYADIELKQLPANTRTKDIRCKYVNDTNLNITLLDSKWFTTLIKSNAFKVRGHFRLQACGEGLKDRKLIWVNDFIKSGCTAPAKMLNQNEV